LLAWVSWDEKKNKHLSLGILAHAGILILIVC
jgi:hypothetical protein